MGRTAVAVGVFDGVHRGHECIVSELVVLARSQDAAPVVLTFKPHPRPNRITEEGGFLLSEVERSYYLRAFGAVSVLFLHFTEDVKSMNPRDFFFRILMDQLGAKAIVVGPTHRFGRHGAGNPAMILELAIEAGIEAKIAPTVIHGDEPISSSRIRRRLKAGDVADALEMLGRPHRIVGRVVAGKGAGARLVGFPTANVDSLPASRLVPGIGVYGAVAHIREGVFPAVVNIGFAPTVPSGFLTASPQIEAHIIGWEGELYGQRITLYFYTRLRDEKTFETVDELRQQIKQDVGRVSMLREVQHGTSEVRTPRGDATLPRLGEMEVD